MTLACALLGIVHLTQNRPLTHVEEETVRRVRADFARVFLRADSVQQIRRIVDAERTPLAWSEAGLLLTDVPMLADFSQKGQLITNLRESLQHRPAIRPETLEQLELLRCRLFLAKPATSLANSEQMVSTYPHDFIAHYRFVLSWHLGGKAPKKVEDSIRAVERLTQSHPIALELWARRDRMPSKEEQKDRRLWEKRRMKAMISLKLRDYAWKLLDPTRKASAETLSWANYLRKKGFTPPEPTAEQYAAVKKRGWAFNKQMLEPFKKVK